MFDLLDLFALGHPEKPVTALWIHTHHDFSLMLLSLLVALMGSCAAFYMAQSTRKAVSSNHRRVSLLCASLVLGFGIWGMHFISMMAIQLPISQSYSALKISLAILPGVLAASLAFGWMQVHPPSLVRAVGSGTLLGAGIALVHYCGIAAMQFSGHIYLQSPLFWLALLCSLGFSTAAFLAQYWLQQNHSRVLRRWGWAFSGLLLTMAMAGMHYLSLHAMQFALEYINTTHWFSQGSTWSRSHKLSLTIVAMASLVFLTLVLANALLRYHDLWQAVAARDARLRAMVDASNDGVITISVRGIVQDFNPTAQRIFGYTHDEVVGRNVSMLMPSPLAEQHDHHLHKHINQPEMPLNLKNREVIGKHKDGRIFPIQLSVGKANTNAGTFFIGYVQDISERKRTDAQLRIAARVFHHVREGIAIVDATHHISDVNPAFLSLMEQTREDCVGHTLESLYEAAGISVDMSQLWQTLALKQRWQSEVMCTRHNGTVWMQRLSISPVVNELKYPHHFIAVISDLSERPDIESIRPYAELHDPATGLPSHVLFTDRLNHSLISAHRKSSHVAIVLLDIQGPTEDADYMGMLQLLSQLLEPQLRGSDTLARVASNRLALLLPGIKDAQSFQTLVHRIRQSIGENMANYVVFGVQAIHCGHASTLESASTASGLMDLALQRLTPVHNKPL